MKKAGNRVETCSAVQTENLVIKIESCRTNCVLFFNIQIIQPSSIPVAARSKAWVCGRSLAGIAGSNTAGGMDGCLL